jgi:hypothetical protein
LIRRHSLFVSLTLIAATSTLSLPSLSDPPAKAIVPPTSITPAQAKKTHVVRELGLLPLFFERNQGQTDARVCFLTHGGDNTLFLTPSEAVFTMPAQPVWQSREKVSPRKDRQTYRSAVKTTRVALRMQMVGSNPRASVLQQQPLAGRVNYFLGKDPNKWHAGVPTFRRVGFHAVYPGVDLVYYGNQRQLEYDFVVAPHADPKQIILHFAGAHSVHLNAKGDLLVRMQGRDLRWQRPTVYQRDAAGKHAVTARFRLKRLPSGQAGVSFALGHYDSTRPLVIDPVLLYSTYLGGTTQEFCNALAVDSAGNTYITGETDSIDFPVSVTAFQRTHAPGGTVFVAKLNPTGTALLYATYLGGSGYDHANSIAIDSQGNAYITGATTSTDFPLTPGAFQTTNKQWPTESANAFVAKLNPTGSALVYSTYLGGHDNMEGQDIGYGIAVDGQGSAYVAGQTNALDFPTTPGAFQTTSSYTDPTAKTRPNGFITKLNATGTALVYSTYLQGHDTYCNAIALDATDNVYVTGVTGGQFVTTPGSFQPISKIPVSGGSSAFVTKLNATGTALIYSTYLSGSASDRGNALAVDSIGNVYVAGTAYSVDFPTTPGVFQPTNKASAGQQGNAFVSKLNPTGSALIYSTYLGGSHKEFGAGLALDSDGSVCIIGTTASSDFPTTVGAYQRTLRATGGLTNAFVTRLNATGTALVYSTYLGGSSDAGSYIYGDAGFGIMIDSAGNATACGYTTGRDFPTTPNAFQRTNKAAASYATAFVTRLSLNPVFLDFNNDGFTDLLIQNASTNVIASWFMNGSTWISGAYFSLTPPSDYALVGAGDFSGNGSTTLVLQSRTTNQIAFWYTSGANNATISGGNFLNTTPPAGWKVVGVGDFNGDGKSDLVFQNQATNQVAIWFMNGYLYQGGVLLPFTPPAGWTVAGVGDFNADGFPDLAFQNQTTGQIALWYMNGATYVGGTVLTTVPASGWKVVGVGDYNGDGSADLLFQNQTSNQAAVWYLTNGSFAGGDVLSLAPPSGWKIVGPR